MEEKKRIIDGNKILKQRKSLRLKHYDYSTQGAYFVTICTQNRQCLFGEIINKKMQLNPIGKIVLDEWKQSAIIRQEIGLDEYIIMPNHFHGIIMIKNDHLCDNNVGANGRSPLHRTNMGSKTLSSFMAGYKSAVTKHINELRHTPGISVWQRNFYEHIIRNDNDLNRIRQYIIDNPKNWDNDKENPNNIKKPEMLTRKIRRPII